MALFLHLQPTVSRPKWAGPPQRDQVISEQLPRWDEHRARLLPVVLHGQPPRLPQPVHQLDGVAQ